MKVEIAEEAKKQFRIVAEEAKEAASKAKDGLLANPEERVQKYFERVFHWAFAEGFVRAYAYFKNKRSGSIKRVQELWAREAVNKDEFDELDQLIRWMK
jgi:hypothetical protein